MFRLCNITVRHQITVTPFGFGRGFGLQAMSIPHRFIECLCNVLQWSASVREYLTTNEQVEPIRTDAFNAPAVQVHVRFHGLPSN